VGLVVLLTIRYINYELNLKLLHHGGISHHAFVARYDLNSSTFVVKGLYVLVVIVILLYKQATFAVDYPLVWRLKLQIQPLQS
jgi:hypothetical protein